MANNPAFGRVERDARSGYANFGGAPAPAAYQPAELQQMYDRPAAGPVQTGRLTMDDVIVKGLVQFVVLLAAAGVGWFIARTNPSTGYALWIGGMFVGIALGFAIGFLKRISVPLILGYAVVEGLFVGAFSRFMEAYYPGIVSTAVVATLATFGGVFLGYKTGLVKVNDRMRRMFGMAVLGYFVFSLANVVALFAGWTHGWGFGGSSGLGLIFSIIGVALASYSLAVDFDSIEQAITTGAPRQYAWLLGHALLVSLVWLYLEIVRLLGRLRD